MWMYPRKYFVEEEENGEREEEKRISGSTDNVTRRNIPPRLHNL